MSFLNEYEFNPEFFQETGELEMEGELASRLLNIASEQEFENFLGNIWDAGKRLYNSPQGQAIKKDFINGAKSFGKKMLPSLSKNLRQYLGGSTGAKTGNTMASGSSNWLFGGVSENDAVDYVRVIRNAAQYLQQALKKGNTINQAGGSRVLVTQAINQAARPIISRNPTVSVSSNSAFKKQGTWTRKGSMLILHNVI
ncbi:hypothetical protein [Chitinophaga flava]|uniref:Uncharacterized protein n=1 Tax=Chitinophaga flava TaxID=2259036 RepID=A0A365XY56_9BACT|nr:hypothetical protein [Chitinophaga flava]RBL91160.1 hypothetical protein DF182_00620 [Chitinophaga flava]